MATSLENPPPPPTTTPLPPPPTTTLPDRVVDQAKTLISALNLISRNLPLPPDVLRAVSSIYHGGEDDAAAAAAEEEGEGDVPLEEDPVRSLLSSFFLAYSCFL